MASRADYLQRLWACRRGSQKMYMAQRAVSPELAPVISCPPDRPTPVSVARRHQTGREVSTEN